MSALLEGRRTKGYEANLDKLFELGNVVKPALENQTKVMEYYRNMAVAMIVFYLNILSATAGQKTKRDQISRC